MKKMMKPIKAASQTPSEAFEAVMDGLEENFSYTLEGFNKLARDGQEKIAMDIMTSLNTAVEDAIAKIANAVAQ